MYRSLLVASLLLVCLCLRSTNAAYTVQSFSSTSFGVSAALAYVGQPPAQAYASATFEGIFNSSTFLRMRVRVNANTTAGQPEPYVIPEAVLPGSTQPAENTPKFENPRYAISENNGVIQCFDTQNVAVDGGLVLELNNLLLNEQEVGFSTRFNSEAFVFGYGERNYYYFLNTEENTTLSLWSTDYGTPWQNPMYGVHPVVFVSDPAHARHYGFLWANSHAQSLNIYNGTLTFFSVGGIVDLYVIIGDSPLAVVTQYHQIIGLPAVPGFWALGVHQCRWGYTSLDMLKGVVANYSAAGIPLDCIWNDINLFDRYRIFTTDPVNYPEEEVRAFVQQLSAKSQSYVHILDPGVALTTNYSVYARGLEANAYVKIMHEPVVGIVWPGWCVFPDFGSEQGASWWTSEIKRWLAMIPVSGLWLDMNEVSSFTAGWCNVTVNTPPININFSNVSWQALLDDPYCHVVPAPENYPPVNPLHNGLQLFNKTLDMTANLELGNYYQTKSFFGFMEEMVTASALLNATGKRPFLLSRATFVGSGRATAHWTGDNHATWEPRSGGLYDSIQAVLAANLWGVPVVGADVGGFAGLTTEELIVRWYQLGAAGYVFLRNHHDMNGPGQEPYRFSLNAQNAIKDAIAKRYRLLAYTFTYLLKAHLEGGPILRHLSLQFPSDAAAYHENTQIVVGDAVMVIPVVVQGATTVSAYIPQGTWYQLWTGALVTPTGGVNVEFPAALYDPITVLVLGGFAIPLFQTPSMTANATRLSGVGLLCALDALGGASGSLWLDDGADSPIAPDGSNVNKRTFECQGTPESGSVTSQITGTTGPIVPGYRFGVETQVTVQVYFPQPIAASITASNLTWLLDGKVLTDASVNVSGNVISLALPNTKDATTPFVLQWSTAGTPAPQREDDDNTSNRALVATLVVVCSLLALSLVAIVYYRRRAAANNNDYLLGSI